MNTTISKREVSVYASTYTKNQSGALTIEEALEVIKTGKLELNGRVLDIALLVKTLHTKSKSIETIDWRNVKSNEYSDFKVNNFPGITWGMQNNVGKTDSVASKGTKTRCALVDFDDLKGLSEEEFEETKKRLFSFPYIKAVWKSVGQKGLGGLLVYETENGPGHLLNFLEVNNAAAASGAPQYKNLKSDVAVKNVYSRLNFISYDPCILIKDDSEVIPYKGVTESDAIPSKTYRKAGNVVKLKNGTYSYFDYKHSAKYINEKCQLAFNRITSLEVPYGNGHQFQFPFKYGCITRNFGIKPVDALNFLKNSNLGFDLAHTDNLMSAYQSPNFIDMFGSYLVMEGFSTDVYTRKADKIIPQGKYLSQIGVTREDIVGKYLVAPTGSGKTQFIIGLPGKKVIVVPSANLAQELKESTPRSGAYWQYDKNVDESMDVIFVTYASFKHFCESGKISLYKRDLYLDEAHVATINSSAGFQLNQMNSVIDTLEWINFKSRTFMSATPVYNANKLFDVPYFIVRHEKAKVKKFKNVLTKSRPITILDYFKKDDGFFNAVLFNNTQEDLAVLQDILSGAGFYIQLFNSKLKEEEHFIELIKTGVIKDEVDGYVCTTVIKEGSSYLFNTPKPVRILVAGQFAPEEIEQFSARFRNAERVEAVIFRSYGHEDSQVIFDANNLVKELTAHTEEVIATDLKEVSITRKAVTPFNITDPKLHVRVSEVLDTHTFKVDLNSISNYVFQKEVSARYKNYSFFEAKMSCFNWVKEVDSISDVEFTKEQIKAKQVVRAKYADEENAFYTNLLDDIVNNGLELNAALCEKGKLPSTERKIRMRVNTLKRYTSDLSVIVTLIKNHGLKDSKWKTFMSTIYTKSIMISEKKEDAKIKSLINNYVSSFQIGKAYSKMDMLNILKKAAKDAKMRVYSPSADGAYDLINSLIDFGTGYSVKAAGNSSYKKYKATSLKSLPFELTPDADEEVYRSRILEFIFKS